MSEALNLAPVPVSVERHLSSSDLGRRVGAHTGATLHASSGEHPVKTTATNDLRPLRLAQSDAAEVLACVLDTAPPSAAAWLCQMQVAIAETFQGDDERTNAAIVGLATVRAALEKGGTDGVIKAIGAFDELLYGLCLTRTMGGAYRG